MNSQVEKRLHDVLDAITAIRSFTVGMDFTAFEDNLLARSAVMWQLAIIGEAFSQARRIDPELAENLPELVQIIGKRNQIIHSYDSVDEEIIWTVGKMKLEGLEQQIRAMLANGETE